MNRLLKLNDMRLKNKLVLIYILIGILPMMLLLVVCYHQMNRILMEKETTDFQYSLKQTANRLDGKLSIYNNLSNYIAFNDSISDVVKYSKESDYEMYEQVSTILDPMLSSLKCFHDEIEQITIYTEYAKVEHDETLAPYRELVGKEWLEQVENSNEICWFTDSGGEEEKVFLARTMPILQQNGWKGILYIQIGYDYFFSDFEQIRPNYGMYILDAEGNMLYTNSHYDEKYESCQLSMEEFAEEYRDEKSEYTFMTESLDETGWQIIFYTPDRLIVRSIKPMIFVFIAALLLCVIAMVFALLFTSRMIVGRINGLISAIDKVRHGHMDILIEENTDKDEVGDLIRSFNEMMERIRMLIREVYESKITQKKLEMRALQAQINPHFLYNSLSLINWKALEAEQEEISRITLALSAFYRTSLNKGRNVLTVRDELENMKSYMEIQLIMHDYEFDFSVDVEEEIMEYETLNLILQPLVENAIDHGIDLKTDGERGRIAIRGWREQDMICLSVEDNGVGMEEEKLSNLLTVKSKGYGVRNINDRIQLYYGEQYGLEGESRVGFGTKVTVRFPVREGTNTNDMIK